MGNGLFCLMFFGIDWCHYGGSPHGHMNLVCGELLNRPWPRNKLLGLLFATCLLWSALPCDIGWLELSAFVSYAWLLFKICRNEMATATRGFWPCKLVHRIVCIGKMCCCHDNICVGIQEEAVLDPFVAAFSMRE